MLTRQSTTRMLFANPNAMPMSRNALVDRFATSGGSVSARPPTPSKTWKHSIDCPTSPSSPTSDSRSPTCIMYGSTSNIAPAVKPTPTMSVNTANRSVNPARTVAITGASGGIGLETVKDLVDTLPNLQLLILCCRDIPKTERAISSILPRHREQPQGPQEDVERGQQQQQQPSRQNPVDIKIVSVDLSDSSSILSCIDDVYNILQDRPLDLLICNAGVMACPLQYSTAKISVSPSPSGKSATGDGDARAVASSSTDSADALPAGSDEKDDSNAAEQNPAQTEQLEPTSETGPPAQTIVTKIEQQYFVNFLSHALLADRLLPALRASRDGGVGGRIVFVSSLAVAIVRNRDVPPAVAEKTCHAVTPTSYQRWNCYGDSKLAMSLFAQALADREGDAIETVSLHPGIVQTDLARHILPKWAQFKLPDSVAALFGLIPPQEGAKLSLELAKAPPRSLESGALYTATGGKLANPNIIPLLQNPQAVDALYNDTKAFIDSM